MSGRALARWACPQSHRGGVQTWHPSAHASGPVTIWRIGACRCGRNRRRHQLRAGELLFPPAPLRRPQAAKALTPGNRFEPIGGPVVSRTPTGGRPHVPQRRPAWCPSSTGPSRKSVHAPASMGVSLNAQSRPTGRMFESSRPRGLFSCAAATLRRPLSKIPTF